MAKKVKVEGRVISVPDDATPDEIDAIANPTGAASTATIKAAPKVGSKNWFKEVGYNVLDKGSNALPAAGGIAGGLVGMGAGLPGSVGGAALGGAAGESLRQLVRRAAGYEDAPTSSLDAAKDIGKEGLKQGAYELGGQGIGRIGKRMAPSLAEAAVAPGKRLLKSIPEDVNIGKTILDNSSGYSPSTIYKELEGKIAAHSDAAENALTAAGNVGVKVPITPARKIVAGESSIAAAKNSPSYIKDVEKVRDQLAYEHGPDGKPLLKSTTTTKPGAGFIPTPIQSTTKVPVGIPDAVDPLRARQLRQGIDTEIGNWNPEAQSAIGPLQKRVYGSITGEIHKAVPEAAEHDAAMTSLIPAKQAAWNTSFNPGLTKNTFERFARPTGALVGAGLGTEEGYRHGGIAGAVLGGAGGLMLPNVISSPTGMMLGARVLDKAPILGKVMRYGVPVVEGQMGRSENKRPEDGEDEEQ